METIEIVAVSALVLSVLFGLKVFSLQRQVDEIKLELQRANNHSDFSGSLKPNLNSPPSSPGMTRNNATINIDDRLRMLVASGKRVQAIKEFRKKSGVSLKEAKDYVDDLEHHQY
ncbi:hypothetical protein AB4Z45_32850 [Paenibacillus sp. MCAF9]|uniref:hypothetical protein n=1 Tax=unclassified Paenibacillus TaxID=185978 RepID=UPI003F9CA6BF